MISGYVMSLRNGLSLTPMHCPQLGARRKEETRSSTGEMEKDSGEGA